VLTENNYVVNYFLTGLNSNDIKISAPDLNLLNYIPEHNEVGVEFQGAHAAVPGLSVPDENCSDWTPDLASLSGYQFIRFRVMINIAKGVPLTTSNTRPQIDQVRLRVSY